MPYQMGDFQVIGRGIRYNAFVPRLYNLCLSRGFTPGGIMPSRAFCSDENQGYPIILIAFPSGGNPEPVHVFSTAKAFLVNAGLMESLPASIWSDGARTPIGEYLTAGTFFYKRNIPSEPEGRDHLENNLSRVMPRIVMARVEPWTHHAAARLCGMGVCG